MLMTMMMAVMKMMVSLMAMIYHNMMIDMVVTMT